MNVGFGGWFPDGFGLWFPYGFGGWFPDGFGEYFEEWRCGEVVEWFGGWLENILKSGVVARL